MAHKVEFRLRIEGPNLQTEGPIPSGKFPIGRKTLKDPAVSNRHAEFENDGAACRLTDLNSRYGTFINGQKLDPDVATLLRDGDVIEIGPYKLTFSQVDVESGEAEDEHESFTVVEPVVANDDQGEVHPSGDRDGLPLEQPSGTVSDADKGFSYAGDGLPPIELPIALALPPLPVDPELARYGLSIYGYRLLSYLPEIYQLPYRDGIYATRLLPETFIPRFLGIFEALLTPIEWNIDNFDLYLNPGTTPSSFLPWLASWYQISFGPTWDDDKRRLFLKEAHWLFAWRGTKKALSRVLEIYTGVESEIEEPEADDLAHTFRVTIRIPPGQTIDRQTVEQLIEINKPAHTLHELTILQ
jgi:phage tail-like protein